MHGYFLENRTLPNADNFIKKDEISIGDWCVFPDNVELDDDAEHESCSFLIGLVLGLTYLNGKTFKQREFSKSFASVEPNRLKPVGVMCDLYSYNKNGVLNSVRCGKHKFFKIDHYLGTIQPPTKQNGKMTLSPSLVKNINKIDD